jgi:hypothetical protein
MTGRLITIKPFTILLVAVSLTLSALGCGEATNDTKKTYVKQEMMNLSDLLLDVGLLDPYRHLQGIESYMDGDFSNIQTLTNEIDKMDEDLDVVIEESKQIARAAEEEGVLSDISLLISYVQEGANEMKRALDLIRNDLSERNNNSLEQINKISVDFQNVYRMSFVDEYDRIARQYGLPEY